MGWTLSGYGMGVSALRTKSVIRDSFSFEQQDNVQDFLKSKKNEQKQLAKKIICLEIASSTISYWMSICETQ